MLDATLSMYIFYVYICADIVITLNKTRNIQTMHSDVLILCEQSTVIYQIWDHNTLQLCDIFYTQRCIMYMNKVLIKSLPETVLLRHKFQLYNLKIKTNEFRFLIPIYKKLPCLLRFVERLRILLKLLLISCTQYEVLQNRSPLCLLCVFQSRILRLGSVIISLIIY